MGDLFGPVVGQTIWNDEEAGVLLAGLEEGDGQAQEVVPVARHEDAVHPGREMQLLLVAESTTVDLMD